MTKDAVEANRRPRHNEAAVSGGQHAYKKKGGADVSDEAAEAAAIGSDNVCWARNTDKLHQLGLEPVPMRKELTAGSAALNCVCGNQGPQDCKRCGIMCGKNPCKDERKLPCYCNTTDTGKTYKTASDILYHKNLDKRGRLMASAGNEGRRPGTCYYPDGFGTEDCHIPGCVKSFVHAETLKEHKATHAYRCGECTELRVTCHSNTIKIKLLQATRECTAGKTILGTLVATRHSQEFQGLQKRRSSMCVPDAELPAIKGSCLTQVALDRSKV